ncbi:MAG TPA: aminomethyl-transferring glycine dehydrogenase subunit GcvPA [Syntrophomonadaceae bacterium]|nr:aminomethyl-transferring glycine dehydrogenase subunit GcvPA [Syntrophomonadaceae bacterium]HPR93163.1 aminomethyl-transferring glycine dehydrogenase subunit GcvPA [Syntrophomonadaceae bacterium]
MKFTPNPPAVVDEMLASIGLNNLDQLFLDIKDDLKQKNDYRYLKNGLSEIEIRNHMKKIAGCNVNVDDYPSFLGAGAYDHYIPAVMEQLMWRSEFYTAYTPYQPEISQGILQAIFEYQTLICSLTGMEVSNASMYDGGSALAEACNLACLHTKRSKVLVPDTVHPEYREVLKTYAISGVMEILTVPSGEGVYDHDKLSSIIDQDTAAVVIQQPNFFGNLEEISRLEETIHKNKGLLIMAVDPISLAILKSPGELGADIAVGEGQSLGNSLSFGGPYLGFLAATGKFLRKIPGRIVGQTMDTRGQRAFVLTLQAREQHIRREKASSNICSNQALNALAASIYLTAVGSKGLKEIALRCHQLARFAQTEFERQGLKLLFSEPYFKEFAVKLNDPAMMNRKLLENGIIGGYELPGAMLLAFTEKRSRAEIEDLALILGGHKDD